jgi:PAS domain S-box-containing protein
MRATIPSMPRREGVEWAALCASLLFLAIAIGVWRWREHQVTGAEEAARLQTQVHGLGDHLGLLLHAVNSALVGVRAEAQPRSGPAASARLEALNAVAPAISELEILDADGVVIASSRSDLIGTKMTNQGCFKRARAQPDGKLLYVCEPFRTATGDRSFNVLRVLQDASGRLDGAVVAIMDIGYLEAMLPSALSSSDMRSLLFDASGVVIVTAPVDALPTGTNLGEKPDSLFNRFRRLGQADATLYGSWTEGAANRIVAYHSLMPTIVSLDQPLVVTLNRTTESTFHAWLLTTELFGALWLLKAGACVALLHTAQRRRVALASQADLLHKQRLEELERIEMVVASANLSLWVWHIDLDRTDIDVHWCAIVGCPDDDLAGAAKTWRERVHADDMPARMHGLAEQAAGDRRIAQIEYRLRRDDGTWIWVLSRGKVVAWDALGTPLRMAGTLQDVTERKVAEQTLRRSEESLATTLQSIGDAVIATDALGHVARMNPTAERFTGWSIAEALGRPLTEVFRIVSAHTREPLTDPVRRVLERGEIVGLGNGVALIARDGGERQIADSAAPIRDPSGAITGVVLVFSDVTEAYRVQQALRDSEALFRQITDALPGTVGRFDLNRRFVFANPIHEQWLGLSPAALIGRSVGEVYGVEHIGALEDHIRRVEAGEQVTFEATLSNPVRGKTHRLVTLSPDIDARGAVRGHFAIAIDTTELRRAEAERRVFEDHLREAQKMDSIGTLAGGIAHDFNNVLGAIIGNAELAQLEVGDGHPARTSLQQISRASQRARGLVRQILTFSRRQPEELVIQALQPLVEETAGLLRATLPARVELSTHITSVPLYVNADATQIQQVLMNLGTNAWHALRGSTGRVTVGLESVVLSDNEAPAVAGLAAGQYAHLWVSDDGVGMDAATRQRIFEPFFTTKPVGQGTGLGLSVVHGITKTHLGAITVASAPGRGTTFDLYLPAVQRPSQVGALDEAEERVMGGRGQHVMYVDDDEVMVLMVERLLERAGYRVTSRANAKEALTAFADNPRAYDLVVTDFNMPGFTGLELAAEMAHVRPDLPLVISSGYLSDELRAGATQAGIRHLLQKQNTFEELATLVERALAEAQVEREESIRGS